VGRKDFFRLHAAHKIRCPEEMKVFGRSRVASVSTFE
jgi:hypothetical protein